MKRLNANTAIVCLAIAAGLWGGPACDVIPLSGETPTSPTGIEAGLVKLLVKNVSGIPINVEEIYVTGDEQVRLTQRYLPASGPESIAEGVWTFASAITIRAKVAPDVPTDAAVNAKVGDLLFARVLRFGRDYKDGETFSFDVAPPESPAGNIVDCNRNGVNDPLDLTSGVSDDCDTNTIPDECQNDGDSDSFIDPCDECPGNPNKHEPEVCGCDSAETLDDDGDGTTDCLDECTDTDSDGFGDPGYPANTCTEDGCPNDPQKSEPGICGCGNVDDPTDSDSDGVPDCVDLCDGGDDNIDCNSNGIPDACDLQPVGSSEDCNSNGVPDECEPGDCNTNGIEDICELAGNDCNNNGLLDECDIADGAPDCNTNGLPDECDLVDSLPEFENAKRFASDAASQDRFGWSVDVDGDTMLVGAYADNGPAGSDQGSAYVFVRDGNTWSEQAKLTASDAIAGAQFGFSVALDGETAAIGARFDDGAIGALERGGNSEQGSVYIFVRNGTNWCEQAKLTASDGEAGDHLGHSVAISGGTVVAGAINDAGDAGADQGSVYVFVRDSVELSPRGGSNWSEQEKLVASDAAAGDRFGWSVAIDGETVVTGAYRDDGDAGADQGSAYVFVRDDGEWDEQAHLVASDGEAGDNFGFSIDLFGDSAIVGSYADNGPAGADQGSAYVFVRREPNWDEQVKLVASDAAPSDFFGSSVSLSGNLAIVATGLDNGPAGADQGSAYLFGRYETHWSDLTKFTGSNAAAGDQFGHAAALNGETLAVGAYGDNGPAGSDQGSVYVFTLCLNDCNSNGIPDECEADGDTDGIIDDCDLCPQDPLNDPDGDGVCDGEDNCPGLLNPDQADCDTDGVGDACVIADCENNPSCADCNSNGIPDGCDAFSDERVYWTRSSGEIQSATFDGTDLRTHFTLVEPGLDIAFEPSNQLIYWISAATQQAPRGQAGGNQTLHGNLLGCALDTIPSPQPDLISIVVKPTLPAVYWLAKDSSGGSGTPIVTISASDLDGQNSSTVFSTADSDEPADLAVDADGGKVYWAQNNEVGTIKKVNLDGQNAGTFLGEPLPIFGLALDDQNGQIFWTRQGLGPPHQIRRSSLASPSGVTLYNVTDPPDKIAVDIAAEKIYWTAPSVDKILRANMDGTGTPEVFLDSLTNLNSITIHSTSTSGGSLFPGFGSGGTNPIFVITRVGNSP